MQIPLMFLYPIFGRYYLFRSLFHSAIFHLHAFLIILLLRLPVGGSVSVMRTTAVRDRERAMLGSKASMC